MNLDIDKFDQIPTKGSHRGAYVSIAGDPSLDLLQCDFTSLRMVDSDPQHTMDPDLTRGGSPDYSFRLPGHYSLSRGHGKKGFLPPTSGGGNLSSNDEFQAALDGTNVSDIAHSLSQHCPEYQTSTVVQSTIHLASENILRAHNREEALTIIRQVGSLNSAPENVLRFLEHHLRSQSVLDTVHRPFRSTSPPAGSLTDKPITPALIGSKAHLATQKSSYISSTPNHHPSSHGHPFAILTPGPSHFSHASSKAPGDIPNISSALRVSSPPVICSPKTTVATIRDVHKFKGTSIMWAAYKSASQGRIDYPDTTGITSPCLGDVYTHTDLGVSNITPQYWQYNKDEGNTLWMDVTQAYELNNGTIRHPMYPDRVLQKRNEFGDPSYITADTFRKKLKKRIEAAGRIVRARSEEAEERAGNESSASGRMR